ncbi:MAG TPA: hypothetical protein VGF24_00100 [Vicinamibacterales bacterium]
MKQRTSLIRTFRMTVVLLGVVVTTSTSAQTPKTDDHAPVAARAIPIANRALLAPQLVVPDSAHQDELAKWVANFTAWQEWNEQWGNRREPGWFTESRQRKKRPEPPVWLFARCRDVSDDGETIAEACALLAAWSTDVPVARVAQARATSTNGAEEADKTTFWEHIHLDGGWPALQSISSVFGVVGMHATTTVHGRFEIFIAPGAMLLNVPTSGGGRAWKIATNYGIAYRLGQFKFPGKRQALLHLNLAKAWLLDAGPHVETRSTDFIGLSMTFKKTQ